MPAALLFAQPFVYVPDTRAASTTPGAPLVGALIYAYIAGTDTPAVLYTSPDLDTEWTQPIETNAAGQSSGPIFTTQTPALKILITDEDDVPLPGYPADDISPYALGS